MPVDVYIVISAREGCVKENIERKQADCDKMRRAMVEQIIANKDNKVFAVLVLVYLLNATLFVMPLGIFWQLNFLWCWLLFVGLKTIVEMAFALPVAAFFNQPFVWWFPLLQPIHIVYIVVSGWLGKFGSYHWKGRNVQ